MTNRDRFTGTAAEQPPRVPLSTLLYGVLKDARKYEDLLENIEVIHDDELAEFLRELRDEARSKAERAEYLLAQRLANGGVR
jgi:hypothetical protein